ncbi:MAG: hypothetical protein MK447_10400 [SAR324 cluster bacterium]|nr:hypothetical protein [SAR324 cluster bacterium]
MDHRGRPESIIRPKLSGLPFQRSLDCDNNMVVLPGEIHSDFPDLKVEHRGFPESESLWLKVSVTMECFIIREDHEPAD